MPEDKNQPECPLSYFTVLVSVSSLQRDIWINNKDDSMVGFLDREGQEEAFDGLKKIVEEQGLVEQMDKTGQKVGTFVKCSTACFFAHYKGKTEDGGMRLDMNIKRVQPMVKWCW